MIIRDCNIHMSKLSLFSLNYPQFNTKSGTLWKPHENANSIIWKIRKQVYQRQKAPNEQVLLCFFMWFCRVKIKKKLKKILVQWQTNLGLRPRSQNSFNFFLFQRWASSISSIDNYGDWTNDKIIPGCVDAELLKTTVVLRRCAHCEGWKGRRTAVAWAGNTVF